MSKTLIKIKKPNESLVDKFVENGLTINQGHILSTRIGSELEMFDVIRPNHSSIPSPQIYQDMDKAAERLVKAIERKEKIVCAVDFDSDGINSGAIFHRAMVDFFGYPKEKTFVQISHRILWGYGMTSYAVKNIFREHSEELPGLIITADQGSSNEEQIQLALAMAEKAGHKIDIVVTDHHHIPEQGPDSAYAFVNPQRQDDISQEHKDICGAMVMFLLMHATRQKLTERGLIDNKVRIFELLSNAAVATISDVMSLQTACNRYVCHKGFQIINESNHPSWAFLRSQSDTLIDEGFIGFQLAPRINAGGRVGLSGRTGLEFLCAEDVAQARDNYQSLTDANEERKEIGAEMLSDAFDLAEKQVLSGQKVIVVYLPNGSSGNSGIVAGKLKEHFNRPALMLAPINSTESTGSARSIPGVDIRSCLEDVFVNHPGIIQRFGGHPVAAGMICSTNKIEELAKQLNTAIEDSLDPADLVPKIEVDFLLNQFHRPVGLNLVDELALLKPFGQKFPTPLFAGQGTVRELKPMGKKGLLHIRFMFHVGQHVYSCVWFNARSDETKDFPVSDGDVTTLAFTMSENNFNNSRKLQLTVVSDGKFDENKNHVFM